MTGLIFDVQGHSVHDGPGCRTLVFLGGCPLRCNWCSNPEGLLRRPHLMFRERLCQACPTRCVSACLRTAIIPLASNPAAGGVAAERALVTINRERCRDCSTFDCVGVCYRQALQISGREWTVEALMRVLLRDQQFWGADGGVTFSGGEPLRQKAFLLAVLERCRNASIHAAIETSAAVPSADLLDVLPFVSWLFVDFKHVDTERHRQGTGAGNEQILANISALCQSSWSGRLVVRTTVVPGFNDDRDQAMRAARFLSECGVREVNLLPFHRLGTSKYTQLGLAYGYADCAAPAGDDMEELASLYRTEGLTCHVGAHTPF